MIMTVIQYIVGLILTVAIGFVINYIKKKIDIDTLHHIQKEFETKQILATMAVRFVEQAYTDFRGDEKLNKASDWLAEKLNSLGIKSNSSEIRVLIESSLKILQEQFGEEWNNCKQKGTCEQTKKS